MGGNTGEGFRKGAVKDRTQSYNHHTDSYVKRDSKTGLILSSKKGEPYKGVTITKKESNKLKK